MSDISAPPFNRPVAGLDPSSRAAALIAALASCGDARIKLDAETGLNRYLSAPYPRKILSYSSSTVSDISSEAFEYLLREGDQHAVLPYRPRLDRLRARIARAYGLADQTEIVFAPSGTDLEYVALAVALGRAPGGVHNVLLGTDEIGSGCVHSAHGRYFAQDTAMGIAVEPGRDIEGIGEISLVDIGVRCADGHPRKSSDIAADMAREIAAARDIGKHTIVHCVHGSKTGLVLPELADLDGLQEAFGHHATFVVDACQGRITNAACAAYLMRGAIVLMTGSKFIGAPPFNGWALVPTGLMESCADLPAGFANIFRRAEWPARWPGASILPDSENPSLALRLEAALFELDRFQRLDPRKVEALITAFDAALDQHVIAPLGITRVMPGGPDGEALPIEMRTLATLDVSSLIGLATFADAQSAHARLALDGIRLGQPVKCVRRGQEWGGTVRIGLSMPQLARWAKLSDAELAGELAHDMHAIATALVGCAKP